MNNTEIISRRDAKALGFKRYYTGKPCVFGHVSERLVSSKQCMICACEKANTYAKKNPELVAAKKKSYRLKNKDKVSAYKKEYRSRPEVKELERTAARKYWSENKEKKIQKDRRWKAANPEKYKAAVASAKRKKPGCSTFYSAKHRVAKSQRVPMWFAEFDEFVWKEAAQLAKSRKIATGITWQVDHMYPLRSKTVSGLHVWNNCQVIPEKLNQEKKNKMMYVDSFDWLASI
jgi:hypothetical protein